MLMQPRKHSWGGQDPKAGPLSEGLKARLRVRFSMKVSPNASLLGSGFSENPKMIGNP